MNTMRWTLALAGLLLILVLAGCGATGYDGDTVDGLDALVRAELADPAAPAFSPVILPRLTAADPRPQYCIGPNDVLTIVIWGRPDLGSTVPSNTNNRRQVSTVDARGEIELPFLGSIEVGGLTIREAALTIQNAYSLTVPSPQVQIEMVEYQAHPVTVTGLVENPTTVFLSNALQTVAEALAAAGGARLEADLTDVHLNRGGVTHRLDVWAAEHGQNPNLDILLQAGDMLYVPPASERFYTVLGDVQNQGSYPLTSKGTTLLEGLARAGGLNMDSASFGKLLLFRSTATDSSVYRFSYFEAVEQGDVPLQPGDRLHVSQSNVTKVGYFLRNILPILSVVTSVWIVDRIINEP